MFACSCHEIHSTEIEWLGLALAVGGMWFVLTAKTNYLPHKSMICISYVSPRRVACAIEIVNPMTQPSFHLYVRRCIAIACACMCVCSTALAQVFSASNSGSHSVKNSARGQIMCAWRSRASNSSAWRWRKAFTLKLAYPWAAKEKPKIAPSTSNSWTHARRRCEKRNHFWIKSWLTSAAWTALLDCG